MRAKSDWSDEEKARWWEEYHRQNRDLVIVPAAPVVTDVEPDYSDLFEVDIDDVLDPEPTWGPKKGSC